jgi:lipoprotein NlpD
LYSIAWRFDRDFRDLARYNTIVSPYLIQPGQRLSLSGYSPVRPKTREKKLSALRRPEKKPVSETVQKKYSQTARSQWRWPASGPTLRAYGNNNAGVDIQVKRGTSVIASASGEVVYAGRGLRGFQHLIIIKHSEQYLSAYGVNQNILVKEGQLLGVGTSLADITLSGTAQQTLHFEIRKDGDHINPATHIKN